MFAHRQLPQGNMHLNVDERDMIEVPKQAVLYYLFIFFITMTSLHLINLNKSLLNLYVITYGSAHYVLSQLINHSINQSIVIY